MNDASTPCETRNEISDLPRETAERGLSYKSRSGGLGGPQRLFYHQKRFETCGFRRHRRAYSVRVARGAPGNEVKENGEMTRIRTRTRARARGREREEKERGRERAGRRDGESRDGGDTAARVAEGGRARPATGLGAHINLHTNLALRSRARYPRFSRATGGDGPLISRISTGLA